MTRRIAYLTNMYPMVSLTFIRREIAAIEAQSASRTVAATNLITLDHSAKPRAERGHV